MAEFIKGFDDYEINPDKLNFYGVTALRDAIVSKAVEDYVDYYTKGKQIASILRNPLTTYEGDARDRLKYKGNHCVRRFKETRQFLDSDYFQNLTQGAINMEALESELNKRINEIDIDTMPFMMKGVNVPVVKEGRP